MNFNKIMIQIYKWLWRQCIKYTLFIILGLGIGLLLFLNNNSLKSHFSFPSSPTISTPTVKDSASISSIEQYLQKGEWLNAYNESLKYKAKHQNDPLVYKYLGISLFQMSRYDESTYNFELALQNKTLATSTQAELYYFIGRNYTFLKDYNKALFYNKTAIQLNPQYAAAYDAIGLIMIQQNRYKEAIPFLEKELSLIPNSDNNPLSSYPYYHLALIYFNTNNYLEAEKMINKAKMLTQQLTDPISTSFIHKIEALQSKIEQKLTK